MTTTVVVAVAVATLWALNRLRTAWVRLADHIEHPNRCDLCGTHTAPDDGAFCPTCTDQLAVQRWDQRYADWWSGDDPA